MDSDIERTRAREQDILRRSEIVERAQLSIRNEILKTGGNSFAERAIKLGMTYAGYELVELQVHRQGAVYMQRLESEIDSLNNNIADLEAAFEDSSKGHFFKLKVYLKKAVEAERFLDQEFAIALEEIGERIPLVSKPSKKPIPSYLDERFNQVED